MVNLTDYKRKSKQDQTVPLLSANKEAKSMKKFAAKTIEISSNALLSDEELN